MDFLKERFKEKHGREPTVWLDKACLNQANIEESLALLPCYLAGCNQLLIIAGQTYTQRLWCVMEIFTFARSECLPHARTLMGRPRPRAKRSNRSLAPLCVDPCVVPLRVCQWAAPKSASRSISSHTQTTIKRKHVGG